jgi:hypothetical protein
MCATTVLPATVVRSGRPRGILRCRGSGGSSDIQWIAKYNYRAISDLGGWSAIVVSHIVSYDVHHKQI